MKTPMWEVQWRRKWDGINFMPYDYDGNDGRKVTKWMLHLGFVRVIRYRIAGSIQLQAEQSA